ncbi:MAG: hypothetical protein M3O33_03890 [Cyanobacteriota bacterium]|nr:hypothetical protein [Cyanobacteriota bacterium]
MNNNTDNFNYQAILNITYKSNQDAIEYILTKDEELATPIEICNNHEEKFKIFIDLNFEDLNVQVNSESSIGKKVILNNLRLEQRYPTTQDSEAFYKYAETLLLKYLNRIIFNYGTSRKDITYSLQTKDYTGALYARFTTEFQLISSAKSIPQFQLSEYKKLCQGNNSEIDEYIKNYLLIKEFSDPVLRLVSSYQLHELIGEKMTGRHIKTNPQKTHKYFEDNMGKAILEIELRAVAIRNLVSHGQATHKDTIDALDKALGSPSGDYHKFDRNNKKHMEQVQQSADKFLLVIKHYLKDRVTA